jgi:hypothetical protein
MLPDWSNQTRGAPHPWKFCYSVGATDSFDETVSFVFTYLVFSLCGLLEHKKIRANKPNIDCFTFLLVPFVWSRRTLGITHYLTQECFTSLCLIYAGACFYTKPIMPFCKERMCKGECWTEAKVWFLGALVKEHSCRKGGGIKGWCYRLICNKK